MPIPTVLWAQRKDKLFLTIDVQDVKEPKTNLANVDGVGRLTFSGKAGSEEQQYDLELLLMKEIDVDASKVSVSGRNVFVMLIKTEAGHWPRLTKDSGNSHVKCDWNKWVDEDEEDEGADKFDFSQYNFSGFGDEGGEGMPGAEEEEEDSDNEDLPDLVK